MASRLSPATTHWTFQRAALVSIQASSCPSHSLLSRRYSTTRRNVHLSSAHAPASLHGQFQSNGELHLSPSSPPSRPLRKLPNLMLLRSLLIATVSSHRFLLLPALSVLKFLTSPRGSALFNVDKNPIVRGVLKNTFYNQFCAGENEAETRQCVKSLKDVGFRGVILTYARETIFDHKTQSAHALLGSDHEGLTSSHVEDTCVQEWLDGAMETLAMIDSGDILALKLTGAGPKVTDAFEAGLEAPDQMMDALRLISSECKRRDMRLIIDAESQRYQKGINQTAIQLMREFNTDGSTIVYNTYQAYLKKTPAIVAEHMLAASNAGFTLGLKIVRGAYMLSDDRALIHDTKQDTDDAYNSMAQGALKTEFKQFGGLRGKYPFPSVDLFLATHNHESCFKAYRLHQQRTDAGLPTVPLAFGQLQGMADGVSFGLLEEGEKHSSQRQQDGTRRSIGASVGVKALDRDKGPHVFKCSTWGAMSECIAYLLRRAVENRDAVLRTKDEYNALKSEAWRRLLSRS